MLRSACSSFVLAMLLLAAAPTHAFEVVPTEKPGEYLKWGPSKLAGTGGGRVTWGFVAAGTPGSDYCGKYCAGTSLDRLPNFYPSPRVDNKTLARTLSSLQPIFQAAFDAWSAVADVQFQYVGIDESLKAVNDPSATSPMIRIGIWSHQGMAAYSCAAVAVPPGLNGGTATGHVFLNANVGYQLSDAPENSRLQEFPAGGGLYMTDLTMLVLRETGHTIGLADSASVDSVMACGRVSATLEPTYLWRKLRADDIAGARFLYGAPRRPVEQ